MKNVMILDMHTSAKVASIQRCWCRLAATRHARESPGHRL